MLIIVIFLLQFLIGQIEVLKFLTLISLTKNQKVISFSDINRKLFAVVML